MDPPDEQPPNAVLPRHMFGGFVNAWNEIENPGGMEVGLLDVDEGDGDEDAESVMIDEGEKKAILDYMFHEYGDQYDTILVVVRTLFLTAGDAFHEQRRLNNQEDNRTGHFFGYEFSLNNRFEYHDEWNEGLKSVILQERKYFFTLYGNSVVRPEIRDAIVHIACTDCEYYPSRRISIMSMPQLVNRIRFELARRQNNTFHDIRHLYEITGAIAALYDFDDHYSEDHGASFRLNLERAGIPRNFNGQSEYSAVYEEYYSDEKIDEYTSDELSIEEYEHIWAEISNRDIDHNDRDVLLANFERQYIIERNVYKKTKIFGKRYMDHYIRRKRREEKKKKKASMDIVQFIHGLNVYKLKDVLYSVFGMDAALLCYHPKKHLLEILGIVQLYFETYVSYMSEDALDAIFLKYIDAMNERWKFFASIRKKMIDDVYDGWTALEDDDDKDEEGGRWTVVEDDDNKEEEVFSVTYKLFDEDDDAYNPANDIYLNMIGMPVKFDDFIENLIQS